MQIQEYFLHYPFRLAWAGVVLLLGFAGMSSCVIGRLSDCPAFLHPPRTIENKEPVALPSFQFQQTAIAERALPSLEGQLRFSLDAPRPDAIAARYVARARSKSSEATIPLPGKTALAFDAKGKLCFVDEGPFWMELNLVDGSQIEVQSCIEESGQIHRETFICNVEPPALHKAEEWPPLSPFARLAEAKWLGLDLVKEMSEKSLSQRFELSSGLFELSAHETLVWDGEAWKTVLAGMDTASKPLARIRSVNGQSMEWEAWGADGAYVRFAQQIQATSSAKIKGDDLFSAMRIRSPKQISCMVEKQCFILKIGDWLFKEQGRWRLLRKSEERGRVVKGEKSGELFVLESIDLKQNSAKGRLFLANRVQVCPIELNAIAVKREKKSVFRGRGG